MIGVVSVHCKQVVNKTIIGAHFARQYKYLHTKSLHVTQFLKLKTQHKNLTGINIMLKVFAFEICLWYFECSASFCKRCEAFYFFFLCNAWICVKSLENVC